MRVVIKQWTKDDLEFEITQVSIEKEVVAQLAALGIQTCWYCGYVTFPFVPDVDPDNIEVHGGITYHNEENDRATLGFDCNHYGDEMDDRLSDIDWLTAECERMAANIIEASNSQPLS